MKKKAFKKCLAALTASVVLSAGTSIMPFNTIAASNIISNSTFEKGTSGWGIYKESGGKATLSTEDGKLAMNVTSLGTLNYAVQLYYDIVPLYQNGVYNLSFEISCTEER